MLLFFLQFLHQRGAIRVPAAFTYSSTRMLLAATTALLLTIFLGPRFIQKLYELKTGRSIRVGDCPMLARLHERKKDTPTMGGILILFSMVVSLLLWMDLTSSFTLILFITTLWLGAVGGYDDYLKMKFKNSKGLSGKKKMLLQILLAGLIALYLFWPAASRALHHGKWFVPPTAKEHTHLMDEKGNLPKNNRGEGCQLTTNKTWMLSEIMCHYYVPFKKSPFLVLSGAGIALAVLLTLVVITGTSNAVNLTDGLDGLASGILVLVAGVLALVAFFSNNNEIARYLNILYIEGSGEVGVYLCALVGACLGFLWYNGYPAQVFMGDIGSIALGGVVGVSAVLLRRELLLALAGGVLVIETLSVMLQVGSYRWRNKKRIFLCTPLHHHFEYKGWPETKIVLRFWIIGLILALIAIISLKFQ